MPISEDLGWERKQQVRFRPARLCLPSREGLGEEELSSNE